MAQALLAAVEKKREIEEVNSSFFSSTSEHIPLSSLSESPQFLLDEEGDLPPTKGSKRYWFWFVDTIFPFFRDYLIIPTCFFIIAVGIFGQSTLFIPGGFMEWAIGDAVSVMIAVAFSIIALWVRRMGAMVKAPPRQAMLSAEHAIAILKDWGGMFLGQGKTIRADNRAALKKAYELLIEEPNDGDFSQYSDLDCASLQTCFVNLQEENLDPAYKPISKWLKNGRLLFRWKITFLIFLAALFLVSATVVLFYIFAGAISSSDGMLASMCAVGCFVSLSWITTLKITSAQ